MTAPGTPKPLNIRKTIIVASTLVALFLFTYTRDLRVPDHPSIRGHTMGTTYEVKLVQFDGRRSDLLELKTAIDATLLSLNQQMSTYLEDSEISKFNRSRSPNPFRISPEFAEVTRIALLLSQKSNGAFDPTLAPLINLWGFGSGTERREEEPSADAIDSLREECGYRLLKLVGSQQLEKSNPDLQVNLGAIAKGFAVDRISEMLSESGYVRHYVEIGGEVRVRGANPDNRPWRIGIERPEADSAPGSDPIHVALLQDHAIATSGDYRNFFAGKNGLMYSHILDPRTGRPVTNRVSSVSVISADCVIADGMATALMVMGPADGLAWVENEEAVEALFVLRNPDGSAREESSSGFKKLLNP